MCDLNKKSIKELKTLWKHGYEFIISNGEIVGVQKRKKYESKRNSE